MKLARDLQPGDAIDLGDGKYIVVSVEPRAVPLAEGLIGEGFTIGHSTWQNGRSTPRPAGTPVMCVRCRPECGGGIYNKTIVADYETSTFDPTKLPHRATPAEALFEMFRRM
jgi:hypothetical protein